VQSFASVARSRKVQSSSCCDCTSIFCWGAKLEKRAAADVVTGPTSPFPQGTRVRLPNIVWER